MRYLKAPGSFLNPPESQKELAITLQAWLVLTQGLYAHIATKAVLFFLSSIISPVLQIIIHVHKHVNGY